MRKCKCNGAFPAERARAETAPEAASVSVESALCAAAVSFLFFFFFSLLQYVCACHAATEAVVSAAESFSCYSSVFYKSGLLSLHDSVQYRLLRSTGLLEDESLAPIVKAAETALDQMDGALCETVMTELIRAELKEKSGVAEQWFPVEPVSLAGSSFFQNGNEFTVLARCRTRLLFPVPIPGIKGYDMRICVKGNCWLSGEATGHRIEDIEVWSLSNLRRGRVIETVFGSNLPYTFPVLDIYNAEERSATMIISLDHTRDTYSKKGEIYSEITRAGKRLMEFESGTVGSCTVTAADIAQRKLLVVMPKNRMTVEQSKEVVNAMIYCQANGVPVTIETYQLSGG